MPFFTRGGLRLHFERDGAGPPVLLLHGIGASANDWDLQLPALLRAHTVIRLDLRGFGRSELGHWATIEDLAQDAADLLTGLQVGAAHVIGHSLGGAVALALAVHQPGLVHTLTLANTFAHWRPSSVSSRERALRRLVLLARNDLPRLNAFIAEGMFPGEALATLRASAVERLNGNLRPDTPGALWRTLAAIGRFDIRGRLGRIMAPTLVVIAGRDTTVAPECSQELAQGIPLARRLVLPQAGHGLPMECPEIFNAAWCAFVADVEARPIPA